MLGKHAAPRESDFTESDRFCLSLFAVDTASILLLSRNSMPNIKLIVIENQALMLKNKAKVYARFV